MCTFPPHYPQSLSIDVFRTHYSYVYYDLDNKSKASVVNASSCECLSPWKPLLHNASPNAPSEPQPDDTELEFNTCALIDWVATIKPCSQTASAGITAPQLNRHEAECDIIPHSGLVEMDLQL